MKTKEEYEELKVFCFNCRKRISEGKRWYHGDQDDLVCLDCAKDLQHLDTAYAGDYVSDMPTETNLNRMVLKTPTYLTDYDRAMQNIEMKSKDTSKNRLERKSINKKQDLLICKSEKPLHLLWKKDRTIMSLKTAKEILLSFKAMGIKEDTACLIFKDNLFHEFRMVGEQHISCMIVNKREGEN